MGQKRSRVFIPTRLQHFRDFAANGGGVARPRGENEMFDHFWVAFMWTQSSHILPILSENPAHTQYQSLARPDSIFSLILTQSPQDVLELDPAVPRAAGVCRVLLVVREAQQRPPLLAVCQKERGEGGLGQENMGEARASGEGRGETSQASVSTRRGRGRGRPMRG
jgi:hypothetical protein